MFNNVQLCTRKCFEICLSRWHNDAIGARDIPGFLVFYFLDTFLSRCNKWSNSLRIQTVDCREQCYRMWCIRLVCYTVLVQVKDREREKRVLKSIPTLHYMYRLHRTFETLAFCTATNNGSAFIQLGTHTISNWFLNISISHGNDFICFVLSSCTELILQSFGEVENRGW